MQKDAKQSESLAPEIQEVMKSLVSAIRIVKIYPSNNPIYSQSVNKSHEALSHALQTQTEYLIGVQKNYLTYDQLPFSRDTEVNKAIVQDLFAKGIREITFGAGITHVEMLEFFRTLTLSSEELAMRNGISSVLWEKGALHIKVTEAGLDDVITAADGALESAVNKKKDSDDASSPKREDGRTLVLGEVKTDPEAFADSMVQFAKRTCANHECVEDRLLTLYQQAGQKIRKDHAQDSDAMFDGLARSVLSMESPYREALVAGKLYGDVDSEIAADQTGAEEQLIPNALHEIRTGRFSSSWSVPQVSTLLKKASSKKIAPSVPPPNPEQLKAVPIAADLAGTVLSLENETQEQAAGLKAIGESGMESDIIEAAVRTLISLIPLVKNPYRARPAEKDIALFSGVVRQLEDILGYLLQKNNYGLATVIIRALHMPVEPAFKPRLMEALKKTATRAVIKEAITDMRKHTKGSAEYYSAYTYLFSLDRKAIEALIDLLAEENDRQERLYLLDLLKELGRNKAAMLGDHLNDERWYVVRNIVSILAESKSDEAIVMLRKAADYRNVKIRLEVVDALVSIGGKKAAAVLAKVVRDPDASVQLAAIEAFADISGIGPEETGPVIEFLEGRPLKKRDQELTLAAIRTLGTNGGRDASLFLKRYDRIRWWKSRKLQVELRDAAMRSIEAIARREKNAGRAQR